MDRFEACRDRARAEARRGRFAEAVAALGEALTERPHDLAARLDLVLVLRRLRRTDDAAREARVAVALAPATASAHEALGAVLFEQGHDREAADAFREVLRLRADHGRAGLHLAWALERLGEWDAAEVAVRMVLARRPDDPQARETLARLLRRQRRPAEAVATPLCRGRAGAARGAPRDARGRARLVSPGPRARRPRPSRRRARRAARGRATATELRRRARGAGRRAATAGTPDRRGRGLRAGAAPASGRRRLSRRARDRAGSAGPLRGGRGRAAPRRCRAARRRRPALRPRRRARSPGP